MNAGNHPLAQLPPTATVLTPNQRLAAYLRQQYNEKKETPVFNSADVLPIHAWLQRVYHHALTHQWVDKVCLTAEQTLALWEEIIRQYPATTPLLSKAHKTAQLAHSAWDLLHEWQIPLATLEHSHHNESEQFLAWLKPFQIALKQNHWLTLAELPLYLLQHLPTTYYQTLPPLYLVAFDEISPNLQTLLSTLQQQGVAVILWDEQQPRAQTHKISCKNPVEELKLALHAAKQQLEQEPNARIGIVVPQLNHYRSHLVALCQKLFYPAAPLLEPEANQFVNISGGTRLSDTLLIQTIFAALKLKQERIAIPDLYWLWHSPYLNFKEYDKQRPLLESPLCEGYNKYLSYHTLIRFLHTQLALNDKDAPKFYTALRSPPGHDPSHHSHHAWVQIIHQYLLDLGFPGNRTLSSADVQRLRAWEEVLTTFASLDTIAENISFAEVITQLHYLCQQKLFQAKTKDAPIQVLGLLEASGLAYTQLWISGLNEGTLPPNPRPHPLLPIGLQKQLAMPHADAAREFNFSQKILRRLLAHSTHAICSYSEENNGLALRPSPLIADFPVLNKPLTIIEAAVVPLKTEYLRDTQGLAITANQAVPGGSYLFKLQAQCPFKAYATLRLKAEDNAYPGLGLSPALRGSIVHRALQYFYQLISAQSQLLSLSVAEQQEQLQKACLQALDHLHAQHPPAEHRRHYTLELARLEKLLALWLEQEKTRPHFRVIATEKRLEANFAGLQFKLQIDRIDKLDDGSELIIDYKTGQVHIDDWFSDRPNEPQLPLYCSVYDSDIKAMAFARVHLQKMGIEGVGLLNEEWPAIKRLSLTMVEGSDPWQQQKNLWREQLTLLAEEFKSGYAAVSPKEGANTCQYCHLPSLCRIHLDRNTQ